MFDGGGQGQMRQRLRWVIEKFRQKGATSPDKAMTIQELELPPRFEVAMHRRLGQLGIFVEVNGKYYLDEAKLKQIQEERAKAGYGRNNVGGYGRPNQPSWYRVVGILLMLPIGIIVAIVLVYFFAFNGGWFPGEILLILLVIALILAVARLLLWRSRWRYMRGYL